MRAGRFTAIILVALMALVAGQAIAGPSIVPKTTEAQRDRTRDKIEAQMAKSYALLIGISEFDNPVWRNLGGVHGEMDRMWSLFEGAGFAIDPGSQVSGRMTHAELDKRIRAFRSAHDGQGDARLVIYISTHGFADPDFPRPAGEDVDGYLITSDAGVADKGEVPNGYSVREFSKTILDLDPQHVFVFLDSCFSGAMLPRPTREAATGLKDKPVDALSDATADWTLHLLSQSARMILTAGSNDQTVPDRDNPFPKAIEDALAGQADADGDGLILGGELAQFVRGRVARETRLEGAPNDPVFAVVPRVGDPAHPRPDAPPDVDYTQLGDFIFLTPGGAAPRAAAGIDQEQALLAERRKRLGGNEFTECIDCPTMTRLPGLEGDIAFSRTEITYAEWDACYRAMGCTRYLPDDGLGRGDRPAGNVTWYDASEYVDWLNAADRNRTRKVCEAYRLPQAREWLAAATYSKAGPATWEAAIADSEPVCLNCGSGMDGAAAQRTGYTPPSDAGLYDMIGNLWEWVSDDASTMDANVPEGIDRAVPAAATPGDTCDYDSLGPTDRCSDGVVMGGSYATEGSTLPLSAWGAMPRTGDRRPYSLPTVGLRMACTTTGAE
ncbi:MAG: SUMF1/EgtB/PvdO family nonheme iron enzyme [Devosia sp.]